VLTSRNLDYLAVVSPDKTRLAHGITYGPQELIEIRRDYWAKSLRLRDAFRSRQIEIHLKLYRPKVDVLSEIRFASICNLSTPDFECLT